MDNKKLSFIFLNNIEYDVCHFLNVFCSAICLLLCELLPIFNFLFILPLILLLLFNMRLLDLCKLFLILLFPIFINKLRYIVALVYPYKTYCYCYYFIMNYEHNKIQGGCTVYFGILARDEF